MPKRKLQKFQYHIDDWVNQIDEPLFTRAWAVVRECVNAHAIADREPEEPVTMARREAWRDFFVAWFGGEATLTYTGMVQEFAFFCPVGLETEFEQCMHEAHLLFRGLPLPADGPQSPKLDANGRPHLVLLSSTEEACI